MGCVVSCIIGLLALKCANLLSALLLRFYFCWSPFNLGFPPVAFGLEGRRAAVTTGCLWDSISTLVVDEPASCSGREGGLIHYFTDAIVSSLDKIILVLFSDYLLSSVMVDADPS